MKITPIFASPLCLHQVDNAQALNEELKAVILEAEQDPHKYRNPVPTQTIQVGIFESELDLFGWEQPAIKTLRNICMKALATLIKTLNGYDDATMAKLVIQNEAWFHITESGGYISAHTHPMSSWSGVYFVDDGQPDEGRKDNGVLRFLDTKPGANMFLDPGNSGLQAPFNTGSINLPTSPGTLVLFPSYLNHEVTPFFGNGKRITIAFNSWCRLTS
ncbi:TIGR02466 family protein [Gallaecimonas kandeliae]|uniref:TIGR02466 family protein n=1 Tax=Gallaecimonas kandeliae TaxID=3029055 RepID=UPI00264770F7|nr:TIGR02466 family protein [Gallaecimonas kandeliae]WKE64452.1 TIGR02466 family protein [Gallaecimonas kandeliae]